MSNYAKSWDLHYHRTYGLNSGKSFWEVGPELSVEKDLNIFQEYFDSTLPLIDMGCGTGEQAVYLKRFFPKVLGVDVAEKAIRIAEAKHSGEGISFSTFDITDTSKASSLAKANGPCNVYMRGVIHQILKEDMSAVQATIKILMGDKGKLYFIEVGNNIKEHLMSSVSSFTQLPESLQRALMSNLPPIGLSIENLSAWFPSGDFHIISSGEAFLTTNLKLPDGKDLQIPAIYGIVGNR